VFIQLKRALFESEVLSYFFTALGFVCWRTDHDSLLSYPILFVL
jgi:hypothetical protein